MSPWIQRRDRLRGVLICSEPGAFAEGRAGRLLKAFFGVHAVGRFQVLCTRARGERRVGEKAPRRFVAAALWVPVGLLKCMGRRLAAGVRGRWWFRWCASASVRGFVCAYCVFVWLIVSARA